MALLFGVWLVAGLVSGARPAGATAPEWSCKPSGRVVLRTTSAGGVYFRRPGFPEQRFACLRGNRWAFAFVRPREGTINGTADVQFAGPFLTMQIYGAGCSNNGACEGPKAWMVDLRAVRENGAPEVGMREFKRAVRIRANPTGDVALIVRDDSGPDLDPGFPPGEGPFRVEVRDCTGRRTVDRGGGIDPGSLELSGRRVRWVRDGTQRTTMVARRPCRPTG